MTDEPENAVVLATASQAPSAEDGAVWQSLVELAKDESVDATKLTALVEVQKELIATQSEREDREAKRRFDRAFAQACLQMPEITKDDAIVHVKNGKETFIGWFKKYEDLRAIVDGICKPLGLVISHNSSDIDGGKGGILVWTIITYVDPEFTWSEERGRVPVPPDAGGAKGAAQAIGSAKTYGERYSLTGSFGIVQRGLDKDGQSSAAKQLALADNEKYLAAVQEGMDAASRGEEELDKWFKAKSHAARGTYVTNGDYDKMVERAKAVG